MSIYRTILENDTELGGVLDDNNCIELKEIEDVVADQDANAFEQDEAQAAEFGTSYGDDIIDDAEDIVDESFMAIAEAEMDFNKLMMAIGIHEVNEMAAGREIIYEAVDIKGYLKRAKDWVVGFFKKVWQTLQRYAANISSAFKTNKQIAEKHNDDIIQGAKLYAKNVDKKMKKYDYPHLNEVIVKVLDKSAFSNDAVATVMNKAKNWDKEYSLETSDVEIAVKKYRANFCRSECDAGDFREKLHDWLCGSEKKEGVMDANDVIKVLGKGKEIADVKKAMKTAKNEYKDAIKKLNELERSFTRKLNDKDEGEGAKKSLTNCVRATDMMKQVLSASQVARASILSAMRSRMGQARMYAQAYIVAANRGKEKYQGFKKELWKENAEYGFLSNMNLV